MRKPQEPCWFRCEQETTVFPGIPDHDIWQNSPSISRAEGPIAQSSGRHALRKDPRKSCGLKGRPQRSIPDVFDLRNLSIDKRNGGSLATLQAASIRSIFILGVETPSFARTGFQPVAPSSDQKLSLPCCGLVGSGIDLGPKCYSFRWNWRRSMLSFPSS